VTNSQTTITCLSSTIFPSVAVNQFGFTIESKRIHLRAEFRPVQFRNSISRSLSDIGHSTATNDDHTSTLFSASKNPQRISGNTPPVFRGLRPRICLALLRLVTKAMSDRLQRH